MRKNLLIFGILLLVIQLGCVESARYSPDEIKGFPQPIQDHIKHAEVVTGMTQQQVRYAWSSPATINILQPTEDGKYREEWIYSRSGIFKTKLVFIDGKLTHIISNEPGVMKND